MNVHLSPDELVDAVEGTLAPNRQTHVRTCATCRDEAERLTMILHETRAAEIPEPSPLFWDRFSARVQAAIADEGAADRRRAPRWFGWPVLVPLAGLALVILALAVSLPGPSPVEGPRTSRAPDPEIALDPSPSDVSDLALLGEPEWAVVSEMVGPVDIERAHEAGIVVRPGDAERAALGLSAAEQQELLRLVKEEIEKAGG